MAAVTAAQDQRKPGAVWTTVKPFLNGGLAGMGATCVIQPVDMIKVRPFSGSASFCLAANETPLSCLSFQAAACRLRDGVSQLSRFIDRLIELDGLKLPGL